ncbi:MAG: 4Fe-4S dicluster domain-containing protein [Candidatus Thorarchaeota archaeon]
MISKIVRKLVVPLVSRIMSFERSLSKMPNAIHPDPASPTRFEIPLQAMVSIGDGVVPMSSLARRGREMSPRAMMSMMKNMRESVTSVSGNAQSPKTAVDDRFLQEIVDYASHLGVSPVGFTKLPRNLVFKSMAVAYDNAIILAMEMDEDKIAAAPSPETMVMIMNTYDSLGIAANKIAHFLRANGYGAQAGHPLGGILLYPPLAQMAGIGWYGRHGMIITPEFGSRVRLAAVLTSIQNLPFSQTNEHSWIADFCDACNKCVRYCPPGAILEKPEEHPDGRKTQITTKKCFPYFMEQYGCTVCVRVCPFSRKSYSEIRDAFFG